MNRIPRRAARVACWGGALSFVVAVVACGASASNSSTSSSSSGGGSISSSGITSSSGGPGAGGGPIDHEVESKYGAPVATNNYVWITNPSSGRVAYIDATSLVVRLVDAGDGPTYLAPVPSDKGDDTAIVLNVLSSDATLLQAGKDGGIHATSFPLPSGGNAWALSPDGRYAIAWTDWTKLQGSDPLNGYQDITVLDLKKGPTSSMPLTVGYRPIAVAFDAASSHAYAVTQDGISVLDLAPEPAVVKNVRLSDDAADQTATLDVNITPDGAYAFMRRDGLAGIRVVTLADGTRTDVTLPDVPTDLDLLPDGSLAVAVVKATHQAAILPVPVDPAKVRLVDAGAVVGLTALAPKSSLAFLYTNAEPNKILTVLDPKADVPAATSVLLRAPILAVFPSPAGSNVVVLHDAVDQGGSHFAGAVSLAPIALDLPPKIVGLDATPLAVAVTEDTAVVATGDETTGVYQVAVAKLPSLAVSVLPLASLPVATGIVPSAGRAYVAQKHPDGRITFVDFKTGQARTLTGFELATGVVDGPTKH